MTGSDNLDLGVGRWARWGSAALLGALLVTGGTRLSPAANAGRRNPRARIVGKRAAPGVLKASKGLWPVVTYCRNKRCRTVRRFRAPTAIRRLRLSPSGKLALLWYRPDGQPFRVAIHRLGSGARLADFSPGFGGSIDWTPGNALLHFWGCGTQCANLRVYTVLGKVTTAAFSNGILVSPSRRYAVLFPSNNTRRQPPFVWDLIGRAPRVVYRFPRRAWSGFRWTRAGFSFDVRTPSGAKRARAVHLPNP